MAAVYEKKLPLVLNNGLGKFFEIMSGKWKAYLLFYIEQGVNRPGQLQRVIPGADRKVLDQQLNELVADGLLAKITVAKKPLHVAYQFTPLGESILPILCRMNDWGECLRIEKERLPDPQD